MTCTKDRRKLLLEIVQGIQDETRNRFDTHEFEQLKRGRTEKSAGGPRILESEVGSVACPCSYCGRSIIILPSGMITGSAHAQLTCDGNPIIARMKREMAEDLVAIGRADTIEQANRMLVVSDGTVRIKQQN